VYTFYSQKETIISNCVVKLFALIHIYTDIYVHTKIYTQTEHKFSLLPFFGNACLLTWLFPFCRIHSRLFETFLTIDAALPTKEGVAEIYFKNDNGLENDESIVSEYNSANKKAI
jgi:hypothetical protein